MGRTNFKNFITLFKKWPVDESKMKGRDLGQVLRTRFAEVYNKGEETIVDEAELSRVHTSLNRIASNYYLNKYPRTYDSTATGYPLKELRFIMEFEKIHQE